MMSAKASWYTPTVISIKDNGCTTSNKVKALWDMLTTNYTMVTGSKTKEIQNSIAIEQVNF